MGDGRETIENKVRINVRTDILDDINRKHVFNEPMEHVNLMEEDNIFQNN